MKIANYLKKISVKGFTLIELLVVIAVLGVLAAAIIAAINPITKINQAKDSNIKNEIAQLSGALQAYYTGGGATATYPLSLAALTVNELKALPSSATWVYATAPTGCTGLAASLCTSASVYGTLNITTAGAAWCWRSNGSAPLATTAAGCTAP